MSMNPKQRLSCSLCGRSYVEEQGHDYNDCAGRIAQRREELIYEMSDLEWKYKEANKRAHQAEVR